MGKGVTHGDEGRSFLERPTVMDIGTGVLLFFASHMVIRTMYYSGVGRTPQDISTFFLIVAVMVVLSHVFSSPLLRLRTSAESALGIPIVSTMTVVGVTLSLVAMLPVSDTGVFFASGALLGFVCGWIVVIWISSIRVDEPGGNSFHIHPSLVVAAGCYFLFRCVGTFSDTISQGFLLALPLVTVACIMRTYRNAVGGGADELRENARALQVLVVVAAAFALGCSIAVQVSGHTEDFLYSGLSYMVLFEFLALALMGFCCWIMSRFSPRALGLPTWSVVPLSFAFMCLPLFVAGLMMGGMGLPSNSPEALWEVNIWVLMVAIFAYDTRESPYAVNGLAVGLLFEVMCVGQILAYMAMLHPSAYASIFAVGLSLLYLVALYRQLSRSFNPEAKTVSEVLARRFAKDCGTEKCETSSSRADVAQVEKTNSTELLAYCQKLSLSHALTPREAEIFEFIAMGRSAKYIAEELTISHNTTRTHIKHIYEKLSIHSKQELIDLVQYGSETES